MKKIIYGLLWITTLPLAAQTPTNNIVFKSPLEPPISLSGNFGTIRTNHFHSGLDIRTDGHIGKSVFCVADGYVSRISISHTGYGNALYITHPNGFISVYGHLNCFCPRIQSYVENYQYSHETFELDINLPNDVFAVKQGEEIAVSGDSGFSGGPHLHFELRNAQTGEYVNPADYFRKFFLDSIPPKAYGVKVYPQKGNGVVEGSSRVHAYFFNYIDGVCMLNDTIRAWGDIGLAVKAYDFSENSYYRLGIRQIKLLVDSMEIFKSDLESFSDKETRYVNAWTDSGDSNFKRGHYIKSFILPGNGLHMLHSNEKKGIISINEERVYQIQYILIDDFGNESHYSFVIKGERQQIPTTIQEKKGDLLLKCLQKNIISLDGFELIIPQGNLYEDISINPYIKKSLVVIANDYRISRNSFQLHSFCPLKIRISKDISKDKQKYYITNKVGIRYLGGTYENGWIKGETRELGLFSVAIDRTTPKIIPISKNSWARTGKIVFKISDSGSGIKTYKGMIDGKFILFKCDLNRCLTCKWKELPFNLDGKYVLTLEAEDHCGNKAVYKTSFNTKIVYKVIRKHNYRYHKRKYRK